MRVRRRTRNAHGKAGERHHRGIVRVDRETVVQRAGAAAELVGVALSVRAFRVVQAHARGCGVAGGLGGRAFTGFGPRTHQQLALGEVDGAHEAGADAEFDLEDARYGGDVLAVDDVADDVDLEGHARRRRVGQRQTALWAHRRQRGCRAGVRAAEQIVERQVLAGHGEQQVAGQRHLDALHPHLAAGKRVARLVELQLLDVADERERGVGRLRHRGPGQGGEQRTRCRAASGPVGEVMGCHRFSSRWPERAGRGGACA